MSVLTPSLLLQLNLLDGHHGHEVVSRVAQIWALEVDRTEVVDGQTRLIEVDNFTASEQHQSVEHLENVGVRLMDSANDSATLLPGEVTEDLHHICGCERVKTCSGLIKEDETWVSDELNTDGSSFTLTTGHTLDEGATDARSLTLAQLQILDENLDTRQF